MSLTENDAIRMAEALDDYDQVTVTDIRGRDADCSIVIRDERFGTFHELTSHCNHLDFLAAFASHRRYLFELEYIESPSGVAHCNGSAAHASAATPGESHQVFIQFPPGDHAGNEERYELFCDSCSYLGATDTEELAAIRAELHTDFFGPLRDLAGVA